MNMDYKEFKLDSIQDFEVDCYDSQHCCDKVLWPAWAAQHAPSKPPVYSYVENWVDLANRVGEMRFWCHDTRLHVAEPEVMVRGRFYAKCDPDHVATHWPLAHRFVDNAEDNSRYHRSVCAPITTRKQLQVQAGKSACTKVKVTDESDEVVTVYATDPYDDDQLREQYLNISLLPENYKEGDEEVYTISQYLSSLSVIGIHGRVYQACVYQFDIWRQFSTGHEPIHQDVTMHVIKSPKRGTMGNLHVG